MSSPDGTERRGRFNRFLRWVFYWLDLCGPDGDPANSKVLSAFGFFVALFAELWWGWNLSKAGGAGITWPFVALVGLTLSMAFGKDVFKAAIKTRIVSPPGGNGGATGEDTNDVP